MTRKYIKNCTGGPGAKPDMVSGSFFRGMFRLLVLGFIGVSVYVLFFSPYLEITDMKITGNKELSEQSIRQAIDNHLSEKFLRVIPKNNFLLITQKGIAGLLKDNFKKIRSAGVIKKFPDSISINIDEREAVLVWCAGESCFLLDENGTAYNTADFNSPEIIENHLLQIKDASARHISIGEKVIDPAYERYAIGIKDALKSIDLEISGENNYETPSNVAEEINVRTSQGFMIYFSTRFSLESAIRTLDIVLEKEIPKDKLENVDYIDLRSEGKVFYKFKEIEPKNQDK